MAAVHFTTVPERYGLTAVDPILKALFLSSLNDIIFLCVFIRSFRLRAQSIRGKCTSRHLFPYSGLCMAMSAHN